MTPAGRSPLHEVAAWASDSEPPNTTSGSTGGFSLENFIARHRLAVRRRVPKQGMTVLELAQCVFNAEHTAGSAALIQFDSGAIEYKCQHASCVDRRWRDVREHLDGPRARFANVQAPIPSTPPPNVSSRDSGIALPAIVSAAELYRGQVVKLRPLFEELLWDGLTMLIARPKAGKSWFTLQLAVQIAGGREVAGLRALDTGPVLYGAFEEPRARTMARLRRIAPQGPWADRLQFLYELMPWMGGGAEELAELIATLRPRLVVLDTLTAMLKGCGKSSSDVFRSQYAEVSRLRKIAEESRTAIILVHHTRKGIADGAVEAVAGTGGIAAAVDTLWYLKRKPEGEAALEVIGREVEDKTFALRFENDPFGWGVLGDDAAQLLNAERREVLALLRDDGALSPAQIAAELAKSRPAVRQLLKRMREDNLIVKQGGKYIPTLSVSHRVTERESE